MDRKTPGGDDLMRYLSGGSTYPWKTMIALNLTEIEYHAEAGTVLSGKLRVTYWLLTEEERRK
jgi:hypothetical protein